MKKLWTLIICLVFSTIVHAQGLSTGPQGLSSETRESETFVTQESTEREQWGVWLKETYEPYSKKLEKAILDLVGSTKHIDPIGKSHEELTEVVNAAFNNSLRAMEMIKTPPELKAYHEKIVELYRITINATPEEESQTKLKLQQITQEADEALTKAFTLHGVPDNVIQKFTRE